MNTYLVAYDIADPKRLAKVSAILLSRGDRIQKSVFRCDLSKQNLVELRAALSDEINMRADQIIFADLGPTDSRGAEALSSLGRSIDEPATGATVI